MYVCMQCMYVKNATPLQVDPCRWIPLSLKPKKTRGKSNCWTILPSFENTPATTKYLLRSTHHNYTYFPAEKIDETLCGQVPFKNIWSVERAPSTATRTLPRENTFEGYQASEIYLHFLEGKLGIIVVCIPWQTLFGFERVFKGRKDVPKV